MTLTNDLPYWLRVISALALICIPIVGALIAWRQVQIQSVNLKHQLYDRRFKIYDATRDFLKDILRTAAVNDQAFATFVIATADASFVFDGEIRDFLKTIREHGAALLTFGPLVAQNLALGHAGPEHQNYVQRKYDALLAINSIFDQLEMKFLPYMQLERPSWISVQLKGLVTRFT
jgi:hypothetical protein